MRLRDYAEKEHTPVSLPAFFQTAKMPGYPILRVFCEGWERIPSPTSFCSCLFASPSISSVISTEAKGSIRSRSNSTNTCHFDRSCSRLLRAAQPRNLLPHPNSPNLRIALALALAAVRSPPKRAKISGAPSMAQFHRDMGGNVYIHPASLCFCMFSPTHPKNCHFDRSDGQPHRPSRSGETRFSTKTLPKATAPLAFALTLAVAVATRTLFCRFLSQKPMSSPKTTQKSGNRYIQKDFFLPPFWRMSFHPPAKIEIENIRKASVQQPRPFLCSNQPITHLERRL
jgi:hypothetical protein